VSGDWHPVTEEPPIGSVIIVRGRFTTGGGWSTGYLLRTDDAGWRKGLWDEARTWADLTDVDRFNQGILIRNPSSTARAERIDAYRYVPPTP
jgi:hypothetical protein